MSESNGHDRSGAEVLRRMCVHPDLSELASVRRMIDELARDIGLSAESTYNLKLAVSEACANAVEHPEGEAGPIEITATRDGRGVAVAVQNRSGFRVQSVGGGASEDRVHRGLGLPLMVSLMDEVRITRTPEGGTVVRLALFDVE